MRLRIQTFWEINLCCWDSDSRHFGRILITKANKSTISQLYFSKELYMFRTDLLSIVRSLNTVFTTNFKLVSEEKLVHSFSKAIKFKNQLFSKPFSCFGFSDLWSKSNYFHPEGCISVNQYHSVHTQNIWILIIRINSIIIKLYLQAHSKLFAFSS